MLIFIDESEWPYPAAEGGYCVWAAIAFEAAQSRTLSRELFNLEKKFWNVGEPYEFELKGRLLLNKHAMSSPKKLEFVEEILSLCRTHGVKAFAAGLPPPQKPLSPAVGYDREYKPYQLLLERLEAMMVEEKPDSMAVIALDSENEVVNKRRALAFGNFLYGTPMGKSMTHIVETPSFVSSAITPGIQLADLVAYVLAQQNLGRSEPQFVRIATLVRNLEWRSNRDDLEYPLRGFRFVGQPKKGT